MEQYGISFDFWNTLFGDGAEDIRQQKRLSFFHSVLSTKKELNREETESAFKASTQFFLTEWHDKTRTPTAHERIRFMCGILNISLSQEEIDSVADFFGNLVFDIPPKIIPDSHDIIQRLSHKFPLGIISDTGYISGKYIRRFLEDQGLLAFFRSHIFSDEIGLSKPHPLLFQRTADKLGIKSKSLIHIGDLEPTDIEGAVNFGCTVICFTGMNDKYRSSLKAHYHATSYHEIEDIVFTITRN